VVRGAAEVKPGELLTVRFAEDQLTVRVPQTRSAQTRSAQTRPADDTGHG
jgi:ribosomal 50S subunit-recycling heat shock protein